MKVIELTRGQVAIVDDEDFERLAQWRWYCSADGYAVRNERLGMGKRVSVYMHKIIIPHVEGSEVDHKNRNRTDNRRDNLRYATDRQNAVNQIKRKRKQSHLPPGVHWRERDKKFYVQCSKNGKKTHVGVFKNLDAAKQAAIEAFNDAYGEFSAYRN